MKRPRDQPPSGALCTCAETPGPEDPGWSAKSIGLATMFNVGGASYLVCEPSCASETLYFTLGPLLFVTTRACPLLASANDWSCLSSDEKGRAQEDDGSDVVDGSDGVDVVDRFD